MKGRLKTYIGFSDDLCVSIVFVDRVYAMVQIANRPCSVGFAHEPIKISDDLSAHYFRG